MNICLVVATPSEIPHFVAQITDTQSQLNPGIYNFNYKKGINISILITGVGITHATYQITDALNKNQFDLCLQAGICGAFDRNLLIGEVVEITAEKNAQSGAEDGEIFIDVFELGLQNKNEFPYTNGWIENDPKPLNSLQKIKKVRAITVETVHGNEESIIRTKNKYHPDVESMEGSPFFYCCSMKKIPFIQIRAVSNYVEKRNKTNWNIPLAVQNLNTILVQLINEITT
ncbi:MAG: futalosine hydrolase [Bacteroidetes bacterium]|nr:futalosine hydrolase [Bacteroidota bacterium]